MAAFLLGTFYLAMVVAGYVVEFSFGGLGLVPDQADATIPMEGISWNYTTWLNIAFLILAAALVVRFFRTGGMGMLKMMGGAPGGNHDRQGHGANSDRPVGRTGDGDEHRPRRQTHKDTGSSPHEGHH